LPTRLSSYPRFATQRAETPLSPDIQAGGARGARNVTTWEGHGNTPVDLVSNETIGILICVITFGDDAALDVVEF
jgi:hypothetical protein